MELVNLSAEPLGKLHSWIPHGLKAEKIVFLPDACPGKSPPPTGTAVLTHQSNWRQFAVSDCGCGMRLVRSTVEAAGLDVGRWNKVADFLRASKGVLGDFGGGPLHFLIHTGSRNESGHVDNLVERPDSFDKEFNRVVRWAAENRAAIHEKVEFVF